MEVKSFILNAKLVKKIVLIHLEYENNNNKCKVAGQKPNETQSAHENEEEEDEEKIPRNERTKNATEKQLRI